MPTCLQAARDDLQKRLKADAGEASSDGKDKTSRGKSPSRASRASKARRTSKPCKLEDENDGDHPQLPKPPSDEEDESCLASEEEDDEAGSEKASHGGQLMLDDDSDLFKDRFEQKAGNQSEKKERSNRFDNLPSDVKKLVENFEERVLATLPAGLSLSLSF